MMDLTESGGTTNQRNANVPHLNWMRRLDMEPKYNLAKMKGILISPLYLIIACSLLIARGQPMMTGDDKFLCHGEQYNIFPASALKNTTELIECQSQFFGEFPIGTFKHKSHLLSIDVSNGSLDTLNSDTFQGAKSLQYFNASRCALRGKISKETFCNHAPDMRFIDLSHNQNLIFTSKPFECLEHLQCIDITGTTQNCSDAETVEWLHLQPEGRVFGNVCPSPGIQLPISPSTQECGCIGWIVWTVIHFVIETIVIITIRVLCRANILTIGFNVRKSQDQKSLTSPEIQEPTEQQPDRPLIVRQRSWRQGEH